MHSKRINTVIDFDKKLIELREWKKRKALKNCDCVAEQAGTCLIMQLDTPCSTAFYGQTCECKCHLYNIKT